MAYSILTKLFRKTSSGSLCPCFTILYKPFPVMKMTDTHRFDRKRKEDRNVRFSTLQPSFLESKGNHGPASLAPVLYGSPTCIEMIAIVVPFNLNSILPAPCSSGGTLNRICSRKSPCCAGPIRNLNYIAFANY